MYLFMVMAATTSELWADIGPFLGFVVPLLMAWGLKGDAPKWLKLVVSLALVAGLTALSLVTEPGPDVWTVEVVMHRGVVLLGEAQALYAVVTLAAARWFGETSMNKLPVFVPEVGLSVKGDFQEGRIDY